MREELWSIVWLWGSDVVPGNMVEVVWPGGAGGTGISVMRPRREVGMVKFGDVSVREDRCSGSDRWRV